MGSVKPPLILTLAAHNMPSKRWMLDMLNRHSDLDEIRLTPKQVRYLLEPPDASEGPPAFHVPPPDVRLLPPAEFSSEQMFMDATWRQTEGL